MKSLFHGCFRSDLAVSPANWQTTKRIKKDWRIHYRFYDPAFKGTKQWGKQVALRKMNRFTDLVERQEATRALLAREIELLDEEGYNPVTGKFMAPAADPVAKATERVTASTPFVWALDASFKALDLDDDTRIDMRSTLKYVEQSARMLEKDMVPVGEIKRKDIRMILDNCKNLTVIREVNKKEIVDGKERVVKHRIEGQLRPVKVQITEPKKWTANQYNHYRKYLSILYAELEESEVIEYNIIEKIAKKEAETDTREVLTDAQRRKIDAHLQDKAPAFRRYVHIFFHSGSRRKELLHLQGKNVDLSGQRFRLLIKKGKRRRWVWKTIKDVALPFWIEAMKDCRPEDYVFSVDLAPGEKPVRPDKITRRWRRLVKQDLGINVDFYSLKHLHTTEVRDIIGEEDAGASVAAEHNSHTSTAMVVSIYDVKNSERKHKRIKGVANKFA